LAASAVPQPDLPSPRCHIQTVCLPPNVLPQQPSLAPAPAAATAANASAALPPIKHVWIVVLENKNYDATFGPAAGSYYLANTLTSQGELLTQYYGTGHHSLDNYITMISGQPPDGDTQADCQFYNNMFPGTVGSAGIVSGQGCVYPSGA